MAHRISLNESSLKLHIYSLEKRGVGKNTVNVSWVVVPGQVPGFCFCCESCDFTTQHGNGGLLTIVLNKSFRTVTFKDLNLKIHILWGKMKVV